MATEAVQAALDAYKWQYADRDPVALAERQARVAEVGRRSGLITYADLVRGGTFRLPNVDEGAPFELGVPDWRDVDRNLLCDFLGRLCVDSHREGGCFASALVTAKGTSEPSEGFWNLLEALGVFRSTDANRRADVLVGRGGEGARVVFGQAVASVAVAIDEARSRVGRFRGG